MNDYERQEVETALREILGQRSGYKDYEAVGAASLTRRVPARPVDDFEAHTPISHQRTLMGDFAVPLAQALATGGFVFVGALMVECSPELARGAGLIASFLWWVKSNWASSPINWRFERRLGLDLNGDGIIGKPPSEPVRPIIAAVHKNDVNGRPVAETYTTLDVSDPGRRQARDLAEFLTKGSQMGFARAKWKGQRLSSGTELGDTLWREWVGYLCDAGILETSNAGTVLTIPLDDALRSIF